MGRFGNKRFYALGRLKQGEMNRTETAYADLLQRRLETGEVLWYKFEGIKFRLADNCWYTPDFAVLNKTLEMEFHEVKGAFIMDDGKAKWKIAADLYPFRFLMCIQQKKKDGGGWKVLTYDTGNTDVIERNPFESDLGSTAVKEVQPGGRKGAHRVRKAKRSKEEKAAIDLD